MDAVESTRAASGAAHSRAALLIEAMDTLPPSALGTAASAAADVTECLPRAPTPTAQAQVSEGAFDGLRWTFRNGFDRVLEALPAAAWADPQRRGWQRVKHNATRDVWRVTHGPTAYYAKYYLHRGWADTFRQLFRPPPCQAEWASGVYALRAGIAVVPPAGYALDLRYRGQPCSLLVTEAIEPAYPLNRHWQALQSDQDVQRRRQDSAELIELLGEMIARAHQAGFEHLDMHAANILVQAVAPRRYRTVFVDLQSARRGMPVSDQAVVRNLAQLNQWFRRHSSVGDRLRFLRAYLRWRNEYETDFAHGRALRLSFEELVQALVDAAERHAERLWARRDRRLGRNGRYFARVRVPGGWRGAVFLRCKHPVEESRATQLKLSRDWWRRRLAHPLRCFEGDAAAQSCKDSHSAMVSRAVLPHENQGLPVIVKRPRARNWRRRIRQALAPSRSARGWLVGNMLLHRDVPTARPLAFLERRFGPLVFDSLLLTEALPGAVDLKTYLITQQAGLPPRAWWRQRRALCALLVRLVRRLQDRGFAHRDCKAENILVVTQPRLKLLWIDMDGVRQVGRLTRRQRLLPLMRLHVSLLDVPGLTRSDRARFLKSYFARFGSTPDTWRAAWRELAPAAEAKTRAKAARRAWKRKHYGRA